jgi:hypothetical protein
MRVVIGIITAIASVPLLLLLAIALGPVIAAIALGLGCALVVFLLWSSVLGVSRLAMRATARSPQGPPPPLEQPRS